MDDSELSSASSSHAAPQQEQDDVSPHKADAAAPAKQPNKNFQKTVQLGESECFKELKALPLSRVGDLKRGLLDESRYSINTPAELQLDGRVLRELETLRTLNLTPETTIVIDFGEHQPEEIPEPVQQSSQNLEAEVSGGSEHWATKGMARLAVCSFILCSVIAFFFIAIPLLYFSDVFGFQVTDTCASPELPDVSLYLWGIITGSFFVILSVCIGGSACVSPSAMRSHLARRDDGVDGDEPTELVVNRLVLLVWCFLLAWMIVGAIIIGQATCLDAELVGLSLFAIGFVFAVCLLGVLWKFVMRHVVLRVDAERLYRGRIQKELVELRSKQRGVQSV